MVIALTYRNYSRRRRPPGRTHSCQQHKPFPQRHASNLAFFRPGKEAADILRTFTHQLRGCQANYTGLQNFAVLPTDVFILSFMKSGTTLMQQLLYQLMVATGRVPSDPTGEDFLDISTVIPFIEFAPASGVVDSIHPYSPRVFESHAHAREMAFRDEAAGRFIYLIRDGLVVAPSYLDFMLDWILKDPVHGEALRREVYRQFFMVFFLGLERRPDGGFQHEGRALGDWFGHIRSWMDARHDHVLFLMYEDMIVDLPRTVRRVAEFIGVPAEPEIFEKVVAKCGREYMASDPRFLDTLVSKFTGWDPKGGVRVREEGAPGFKQVSLPEECVAEYRKMFYDAFGVQEYSDLVDLLNARNPV